ncbi:uncharacterized protein LOC129231105 [Uloborus diversus]|uniref:uncharacterized protein LOC129231105 n=1 Tax=Uloborus diversus TaxID=327109 RepID=UPI002409EB99|nr:uncharacterized protein LOC129231105 [Uloborus diversus]
MERMLLKRLIDYSLTSNIFPPNQFGFLPFRGCDVILTSIHHEIFQSRSNKLFTFLVALDLKGAYDSVWTDGLIWKMMQAGIQGKAAYWIHNFINNRSAQVEWRGNYSAKFYTNRGVPQGAVLSPFLFQIYIADLCQAHYRNTKLFTYADDIFLISSGAEIDTALNDLQAALLKIQEWCECWHMKIVPEKCVAINFSNKKKKTNRNLSINGKNIKWSEDIRILGLIFDRNLTFKNHINHLSQKVYKYTNILKAVASKRWGARTKDLLIIAKSCIKSKINFGSHIFSSCSQTNKKKIETIYHSAIRVAVGLPKFTPIPVLLMEAKETTCQHSHSLNAEIFMLRQVALGNFSTVRKRLLSFETKFIPANTDKAPLAIKKKNLLKDLNIYPSQIIPLCIPIVDNSKHCNIFLKSLPFQNDKIPNNLISKAFHNYSSNNWNNNPIIASDASKVTNSTSIGIYNNDTKECIMGRIPHENSVFTAEDLALWLAIRRFGRTGDKVIFLSDSLSVLTALKNVNNKSPHIITMIAQIINSCIENGHSIDIAWTPAHVGIQCNEIADKIANMGHRENLILHWKSPEDIIQNLRNSFKMKTLQNWNSSHYAKRFSHLININDKIRMMPNSRYEDVLISRARTRTTLTNYNLFQIRRANSPLCSRCKVPETLDHAILECSKYTKERDRLRACAGCVPLSFCLIFEISFFPPRVFSCLLALLSVIDVG